MQLVAIYFERKLKSICARYTRQTKSMHQTSGIILTMARSAHVLTRQYGHDSFDTTIAVICKHSNSQSMKCLFAIEASSIIRS